MPNGVAGWRWPLALTRVGAVLVPLSTLLAAGELVAQLRAAAVQFLVSVEEFRGHRYLDDLRAADRASRAAPGLDGRRLADSAPAIGPAASSTPWPPR